MKALPSQIAAAALIQQQTGCRVVMNLRDPQQPRLGGLTAHAAACRLEYDAVPWMETEQWLWFLRDEVSIVLQPSMSDSFNYVGTDALSVGRPVVGSRAIRYLPNAWQVDDPNDPADLAASRELQDRVEVRQANAGTFEVPDWDEASLRTVRDALNVLAATKPDASGMFGDKAKLDPIDHLLGTAYGWGGNPREAAVYQNGAPALNDGKTPHVLTVREVPVDGFWSITVYNAKGFMEPNALNAYSVNDVTAKRNPDGSVTVHFGGDPGTVNYLPITEGWNYVVRMYQPRQEIVDGSWKFPDAQPAR
jgi:hypothetical protein